MFWNENEISTLLFWFVPFSSPVGLIPWITSEIQQTDIYLECIYLCRSRQYSKYEEYRFPVWFMRYRLTTRVLLCQSIHSISLLPYQKGSTVSINVACITRHGQVTVSARVSSVAAGVKKWLGLVRTPKVPVSQSAIDPLRRRLFHLRRPALAIPYYISLLTPQPQTHLTSTNEPPPPPTNNHPEESQLRTASASSPLRAYSLTSLSPTDAGPGRRNHVESQEQRHHTKRSLIRHPRARCRYRASRHPPLREIAVPPDLQKTTGKP